MARHGRPLKKRRDSPLRLIRGNRESLERKRVGSDSRVHPHTIERRENWEGGSILCVSGGILFCFFVWRAVKKIWSCDYMQLLHKVSPPRSQVHRGRRGDGNFSTSQPQFRPQLHGQFPSCFVSQTHNTHRNTHYMYVHIYVYVYAYAYIYPVYVQNIYRGTMLFSSFSQSRSLLC